MGYRPGNIVPQSGIYRCNKCGNEVTCVKGEPFPPCANGCSGNEYYLVRATN
ncbi:MAG: YjzC family protein [Candidatus Hydrogenedentes bacterium]|nr:YjzC family protein [Candidatus Hydrogenedentota bacterium]